MSTSSIKKISAAVVAVVLSGSAMSRGAQISLPYNTSFPLVIPDSNNDTYSAAGGNHLEGQKNWVDEVGEAGNVATVNAGGGSITLSATPSNLYSDVFNSNLASNASETAAPFQATLNPAPFNNNIFISYNMNVNAGGTASSATNTFAKSSFGVEVIGSDDQIIASLFEQANKDFAGEEDVVVNEGQGNAQTAPAPPVAPNPGTTGAYSIDLNFTNHTFTVFVGGVQDGGAYQFANAGESQIGAIAFATDNAGTNSAVFSNLSVVPEPASMAMIGLGGLVFLARRPKRLA